MNPRLISLSGLTEGTTIQLAEDEILIGRVRSNTLWIKDTSVSRRHCMIRKEDSHFKLIDLESSNGTRVNGVPIKERALAHGDRIQIGDSLFLFLLDEEKENAAGDDPVQFTETSLSEDLTTQIHLGESFYLHPELASAPLRDTARMARYLSALLTISTSVNSSRTVEAIEKRLLESIFEVIPAERGALLLFGKGSKDFDSICNYDRQRGSNLPIKISRTVLNHVISERVALLSSNILEHKAFNAAASLEAGSARSLLCVPLSTFEEVIGVLYLESSSATVCLDDDHLQMATALVAIATVAIQNVQHVESLAQENRRLQSDLNIERNMIGESARMLEIYQLIAKVAPSDSTVLIYGESGTGKELAAHAIHANSPRADKPFVAINCAALTETLLESELFGHEKGAFTGAYAQKKGKLELAEGGSLFLDEIGEITPLLQVKLLRVLQEREFERVGSTKPIKMNVRLIAATNRDLLKAIQDGRFRHDLYYRLNVVQIKMPPLRERREDIPLLATYFVDKYSQKCKRRIKGISAEARKYLASYDWPGNVRELENAIERAAVLSTTDTIVAEDLPEVVFETQSAEGATADDYHKALKEAKKQIVLKAIQNAEGNFIDAAKHLNIHVNNLYRMVRSLDLKIPK